MFLSTGLAVECHQNALNFTFFLLDADLLFPSFNGNSYLELPFFTTLDEFTCVPEKEHNRTVTIYLTIKTNTLNGTILYSEY